jgi:Zn finger protein HypA/HybF involved in hydrogenase expression
MPERMIHCRNCRALLNTDLESDSVEIPEFVPLREIDNNFVEARLRGYYIDCPHCRRELRVNTKYAGRNLTCKSCRGEFLFALDGEHAVARTGLYVRCPHCKDRLRMTLKYIGLRVLCKACQGKLMVVEE